MATPRPSRSRNRQRNNTNNNTVDLLFDTINEYTTANISNRNGNSIDTTVARRVNSKKNDYDYDDDDDDDANVIDVDTETETETDDDADAECKDIANNNNNKTITLPGGSAAVVVLPTSTTKCQTLSNANSIGEIPRNITSAIRDYMDVLFSSVIFEALNVRNDKPINVIPGIVNAILEYNNISFKTLTLTTTNQTLHEPIWYVYNIASSTLNLILHEQMFDMFCMKISDKPVTFSGGVIPIELYNPYAQHDDLPEINRAMINYAVACDHVAQHIIVDILEPKQSYCLGIHDRYACIGTTLHSIFAITQNVRQPPRCDLNPANYFTSSAFMGGTVINNGIASSHSSIIDQVMAASGHQNNSIDINIGDYRPFQPAAAAAAAAATSASIQQPMNDNRQNSFHFTV